MMFPPFTGFPPGALSFFRGLAANNERAWFTAHKADYERDVLAPMKSLIADLVPELQAKKLPFIGDPARAIFRIHRDVRFARDKAPYKTHAGAVLTRTGQKWNPGLLYVHVDPTGSFCAAGFYQPEPEPLSCLREAIATEPKTSSWQTAPPWGSPRLATTFLSSTTMMATVTSRKSRQKSAWANRAKA